MAHKYEDNLQVASQMLQDAMDGIANVLPDEMAALLLGIVKNLKLQQGKIHSLLGRNAQSGNAQAQLPELPPLTHIMGQPIVMEHEPVTAAKLTPDEEERTKFLNELNDFYIEFPNLQPEQIKQLIQIPGGETKIRALAQKVGIGDFRDAEINIMFIDAINKGIRELNAYDQEMQAAAELLGNKDAVIVESGKIPQLTGKKRI